MDLNTLWFILIAVLYIGFFVLEGFDFGVGMLQLVLGKSDKQRRMLINTIGPYWDGNEVWLLTAGGATFAAFPEWYATLFSGFYLPLFLLLLALIIRGVAIEFRSKDTQPCWRSWWDRLIFVGSLVPALLLGVAFANLMRGVPINADKQYVGGFFNLLNWYALLGGLTSLSLFILHGAAYLSLKTEGELRDRAQQAARRVWPVATLLLFLYFGATYIQTDILEQLGVNPGVVPVAGGLAILAVGYALQRRSEGWAFLLTAATILFSTATIFLVLFPRVMVSSLDPSFSLTIYNASSSAYTLRVMTIVALTLVPVVLGYQAWSYWVFRKRITEDAKLEY